MDDRMTITGEQRAYIAKTGLDRVFDHALNELRLHACLNSGHIRLGIIDTKTEIKAVDDTGAEKTKSPAIRENSGEYKIGTFTRNLRPVLSCLLKCA